VSRRGLGSSPTVGRSGRLREAGPDGVGEAWVRAEIDEGTEDGRRREMSGRRWARDRG